MPRVKPYTKEQKEEYENKQLYKEIIDHLNSRKGRDRKTDETFAKEIGVGEATWQRWKRGNLSKCEFENILNALNRCGMKLIMIEK